MKSLMLLILFSTLSNYANAQSSTQTDTLKQGKVEKSLVEQDHKTAAKELPAPQVKVLPNAPTESVKKSTVDFTKSDAHHQIIRRIVVFPFHTPTQYKSNAENSWWKIREFLTDTKRFLVATKRYMGQRDAFQARKKIKPSDCILLGSILDAEALVSTIIDKYKVQMIAYSTRDGFPLWEKSYPLNLSLSRAPQIESISLKLIKDFIATIPYHGFQIVDPLIGTATFEEGDVTLAKIDVGAKSLIKPGEKIQWIHIERQSSKPLFQGGGRISIIAEGEVIKNEMQTLLVEVQRTNNIKLLHKKALAVVPMEYKRLQDMYALYDGSSTINTTVLSTPLYPTYTKASESKPLITALASIASFIGIILLAF